jgi:hypothetical protein
MERKEICMLGVTCSSRRIGPVCLLSVLALLISIPCIAQDTAGRASRSASATFVSRLQAEPVDYQVKLTWVDAPDVKGTYLVYRAAEEITSQTVSRASLAGAVDAGVQFFVDTPPNRNGFYYAVLLRDPAGTLYPLVIPFRNKTSAPVAPTTSAPEEKLAASITGLRAALSAAGDSIEVTFRASNPARDLLLFWGTSPLMEPADLLHATSTIALDPGTTHYTVPVLSGIDYWFAVLDAGLYKLGRIVVEKGVSSTASAVQAAPGSGRSSLAALPGGRRTFPLPALTVTESVQTGSLITDADLPDVPVLSKVSPDTQKAIAQLLDGLPRPAAGTRPVQVLRSDMTPTPDGELAHLQEIIRGPFLGGEIVAAHKGLQDFLSLPRSRGVEARARFYLGQIYSVEGRPRDALLEFLIASEFFYQESEAWIDACFAKLESADQQVVSADQ